MPPLFIRRGRALFPASAIVFDPRWTLVKNHQKALAAVAVLLWPGHIGASLTAAALKRNRLRTKPGDRFYGGVNWNRGLQAREGGHGRGEDEILEERKARRGRLSISEDTAAQAARMNASISLEAFFSFQGWATFNLGMLRSWYLCHFLKTAHHMDFLHLSVLFWSCDLLNLFSKKKSNVSFYSFSHGWSTNPFSKSNAKHFLCYFKKFLFHRQNPLKCESGEISRSFVVRSFVLFSLRIFKCLFPLFKKCLDVKVLRIERSPSIGIPKINELRLLSLLISVSLPRPSLSFLSKLKILTPWTSSDRFPLFLTITFFVFMSTHVSNVLLSSLCCGKMLKRELEVKVTPYKLWN